MEVESDKQGQGDQGAQQQDKHEVQEEEDGLVHTRLHSIEHNVQQEAPLLLLLLTGGSSFS